MEAKFEVIKPQELLKRLEENRKKGKQNHLLLGNGFNGALGVSTGYEEIFTQMKKIDEIYKRIENGFKFDYDIEVLIGEIKRNIKASKQKKIIEEFNEQRIKLDFMKAANHIVQNKIQRVVNKYRGDVHTLFTNFDNYFTLNYDPFLYLLLMRFKKKDKDIDNFIAIEQNTLFDIEMSKTNEIEDPNEIEKKNEIKEAIKNLHENGLVSIGFSDSDQAIQALSDEKKTSFKKYVKKYFENNEKFTNISQKDIEKQVDEFWLERETHERNIDIDDGFISDFVEDGLVFSKEVSQNLFFLHGAFHIYQDKDKIKKMTKTSEQSLYEEIEKVIEHEKQDIICVFTNDNKISQIENNPYLKYGYKKLLILEDSIVIFGSSLMENDRHIFDNIQKSNVDTIYISCYPDKEDAAQAIKDKANSYFNNKNIVLFWCEKFFSTE